MVIKPLVGLESDPIPLSPQVRNAVKKLGMPNDGYTLSWIFTNERGPFTSEVFMVHCVTLSGVTKWSFKVENPEHPTRLPREV